MSDDGDGVNSTEKPPKSLHTCCCYWFWLSSSPPPPLTLVIIVVVCYVIAVSQYPSDRDTWQRKHSIRDRLISWDSATCNLAPDSKNIFIQVKYISSQRWSYTLPDGKRHNNITSNIFQAFYMHTLFSIFTAGRLIYECMRKIKIIKCSVYDYYLSSYHRFSLDFNSLWKPLHDHHSVRSSVLNISVRLDSPSIFHFLMLMV